MDEIKWKKSSMAGMLLMYLFGTILVGNCHCNEDHLSSFPNKSYCWLPVPRAEKELRNRNVLNWLCNSVP